MNSWEKFRKLARHYLWGCFAKSWNGAIAAIYGTLGQTVGAAFDPDHFSVPTWRTIIYIFGVAFGISAVGFFKDHPLPDSLSATMPPFAGPKEEL